MSSVLFFTYLYQYFGLTVFSFWLFTVTRTLLLQPGKAIHLETNYFLAHSFNRIRAVEARVLSVFKLAGGQFN